MDAPGIYIFAFFFGLACSHPVWDDDFTTSTPNIIIMLMDDVRFKFLSIIVSHCLNVGSLEMQKLILKCNTGYVNVFNLSQNKKSHH